MSSTEDNYSFIKSSKNWVVNVVSGSAFIPKCSADWCSVWHLGSQAISIADCDFYMCTNSTDEVQSLVSAIAVFASVILLVDYLCWR